MTSEQPSSPASSPTRAAAALPATAGRTASHDATVPSSGGAVAPAIPSRPASPPNQMTDPVAALQAAFPSMDRTIITEVLAAHGGNPDAASMALLEISGTTNTNTAGTGSEHAKNAQMLADEAYARELMAQMEREHMQEYGRPIDSRPPQGQQNQEVDYSQLNYQPRQQRNRFGQPVGGNQQQQQGQYGQQQQGQGEEGRWKHQDELDQLTEQFGKFADTGKKTFNSLLSKAKDKYAQVQQQQREYQAQQRDGTPTTSGNTGLGTGPTTIAGFTIPSIPAPWQGGFGSKAGVVGHASNERTASPREKVRAGAMSPEGRETVMKDYSGTSPLRDGRPRFDTRTSLDDDAPPIQIKRPSSSSSPMTMGRTSSTTAPTLSSSPATNAPGFSTSPAANSTNTRGFGSSPAKVQMLPRQTINLLEETGADKERERSRSGSPALTTGAVAGGSAPTAHTNKRDDDDSDNESVEYVRNPFNDDD